MPCTQTALTFAPAATKSLITVRSPRVPATINGRTPNFVARKFGSALLASNSSTVSRWFAPMATVRGVPSGDCVFTSTPLSKSFRTVSLSPALIAVKRVFRFFTSTVGRAGLFCTATAFRFFMSAEGPEELFCAAVVSFGGAIDRKISLEL